MTTVTAKSRTITNGTANDGSIVEAEMVELYNNDQTLATAVTNLESGNVTISGNKTFSGSNTHSGTNTFSGNNTFSSGVTVSSTPAVDGEIGYTSNQFQGQRNSSVLNFLMAGDSTAFPAGYIGGPPPKYVSAATITLPAGMRVRNSADTADIVVGSDITPSLAASGAAGRDTGAEASNTWYYVYLIKKSSDGTVSAVFSVTNESVTGSITYPSGYDQKRQLPIAIRNDGSSNIIPFTVVGWGVRARIDYDVSATYFESSFTTGPTNVLSAGAATSYTTVGLSSFVPPISRRAILAGATSTSGRGRVRTGSASDTGISFGIGSSAADGFLFPIKTDSSQQVEYTRQSGASPNLYLDVMGYVVTEMS